MFCIKYQGAVRVVTRNKENRLVDVMAATSRNFTGGSIPILSIKRMA